MEQSHVRLLDTLKNINAFGTAHAADFPAGGIGATQFAAVAAAVTQTSNLGGTQISGKDTAHGAAMDKAATRISIRADLSAINHAAHSLALMGTAGLDGKFQMPRGSGDQALLNAARAFAADAVPFSAQFIQLGLPAGFIATLNADITALETANTAKAGGVETKSGATGGIAQTIHDATTAMQVLDTVVRNTYRNNATALAAWITASHVERPPQHAAKPAPATPKV